MSHMVIYRTGDGQPGYHQTEELDEAVKYVERLRNGDGVDGARIFRMEEVNFDFRPYFKVEIGPTGEPINVPIEPAGSTPPPAPAAPAPPATAPATPDRSFMPDPVAADAPAPVADAPGDAWGDLGGGNDPSGEPTPLVEQAAAFMPDTDAGEPAPDTNGDHAEDGVGARRGLFGR